ncbi:hypothetical protein AAHE18_03G228300 [Arachis hypogaea]
MIRSQNGCTNNHKRPFALDSSSSNSNPIKNKKPTATATASASVLFTHFDSPLLSSLNGVVSTPDSIILHPDSPYTIGRTPRHCDFFFRHRHVSKRHCQILFDGSLRKLYILNGVFLSCKGSKTRVVHEFRKRMMSFRAGGSGGGGEEVFAFRKASNGVFVNGVEIGKGTAVELSVGDKVSLVCGNDDCSCGIGNRVGFLVQRIVFENRFREGCDDDDEIDGLTCSGHSQGNRNKRVLAVRANGLRSNVFSRYERVVERANFILERCREILLRDDPVSCIFRAVSDTQFGLKCDRGGSSVNSNVSGNDVRLLVNAEEQFDCDKSQRMNFTVEDRTNDLAQLSSEALCEGKGVAVEAESDELHQHVFHKGILDDNVDKIPLNSVGVEDIPSDRYKGGNNGGMFHPSPGKNFYLNRLQFSEHASSELQHSISLPELLYPVESISRMFIATFTSDINWFLTYCKIPFHLPVTVACHNTERCWSSRPNERVFVPYPDYPNLVVVYPSFPETIAFGSNHKRQGIACHHPKLIVLQREDNIRVIITSANLVEKQWNSVTNTIWWQDFPRAVSADFASLFPKSDEETQRDSKCDFAGHLAGFMAALMIDIPSQAHWITLLTKYDFGGATGHLVASVPGIHFYRTLIMPESFQSNLFLGSVVASVVGLSHLFRSSVDSKSARLKALATFLGKSCTNAYGKLKVILRRNHNVPADENAVSILVPDPDGTSEGDYVQLGFLPRNVAKWVSPLWDAGFLRFSGYVCPKEALAAALGENPNKVQLILNVSRGNHFQDTSKMMESEHIAAFGSLIASIQRCYGLWRLQEVLNRYKWPESLESDIIYGASSIGSSVNSKFLAAFSAAAGKKSLQHFDSEESDPEWGCWNARDELKNPSVRIIFPTIGRVKNAYNGILPSRRILCFTERTWQRLKTLDILHDAIPHPHDRIGHPMHTKVTNVVRRRFWSKSKRDAPSIGWVYCGSHNFSAAAWGRQISNPFDTKSDGPQKGDPCSNSGLHICNYELGIIFTFPPTEENTDCPQVKSTRLDDIALPFVVPAPKYGWRDRPATMQAMKEAMTELNEHERLKLAEEEMLEEVVEEEEEVEGNDYVGGEEEKEEEKAYAEILWSQVDSSEST